MRELRLALRALARSPGYSLTVVLTLGLAIGAAGAVGSVLHSVLLRPLPYAPADRVLMLAEFDSAGNNRPASYPTFQDWKSGTNAFESMAYIRGIGAVMKADAGPVRLVGASVNDEFFQVLPELAAVGRTLDPGDFAPGAPSVVVLSYHLWQRRFAGDRHIVGRLVTLSDRTYTVVGVMPANFVYPTWADLYAPIGVILATDKALSQRGVHTDSRVVGRVRTGVDPVAARRSVLSVAAHLAEVYPAESGGWRSVGIYPVVSEILGDIGSQLRMLTGAAVFVLLIACVNVAGLSLARATARSRDLAIRIALGAGRATILRHLMVESVVLAGVAGALGLATSVVLVRWIRSFGGALLPRVDEVGVDDGMVLLATAFSVVLVVAFGLVPVLRFSSDAFAGHLKDGVGAGTGRSRNRLRAVLVVTEFALSLVLLAGAGLLVRSLLRLQQVNPGFDVDHLLAMPIFPPPGRYTEPEQALALYKAVAAAVATVPGVRSVSLTNHVPLSGASMPSRIEADGVAREPDEGGEVLFREVDDAYFRTAGIPIVMGRGFTSTDIASPAGAAIVNQYLARRYWPGKNPVGQPITLFKSAQGRAEFGQPVRATVVGVVGDVRHYSPETDVVAELYVPYTLTIWGWMSLVARVDPKATGVALGIRRAILAVDPDIPLEGADFRSGVYEVSESLRDTMSSRRLITGLLVAFAVPSILLAGLGIYGVVAYIVSLRGHEIAIRMALGAHRDRVLQLVLAQGMRLALIGVMLGALGAAALTRLLQSQLYQVSPTDPVSFIGAALVLCTVGLVATFLPALRATRVEPTRALRAE
jgi:putative ABC transport system permease protein